MPPILTNQVVMGLCHVQNTAYNLVIGDLSKEVKERKNKQTNKDQKSKTLPQKADLLKGFKSDGCESSIF